MKDIDVVAIKGEVKGFQKHSKTSVYSIGGGGFVGQNGGYVSAPEIRSNSTEITEFFVRTSDGKETHVKLTGLEVAMRDGHMVTMVMAKNKNVKRGYWAVAINHDTEKKYKFYSEANLLDMGITKGPVSNFSPTSLVILLGSVAIVASSYQVGLLLGMDKKLAAWSLHAVLVLYLIGRLWIGFKRNKQDSLNRLEFEKAIKGVV